MTSGMYEIIKPITTCNDYKTTWREWHYLTFIKRCSYIKGWSDFHFFVDFRKCAHCYRFSIFLWDYF